MKYSLSFFVILGAANVFAESEMKCYNCNSAVNETCSSSDVSQLKDFIEVCEPLTSGTFKGNEAVRCRKIVQQVEGMPRRTIRECAYTDKSDGLKKQGNKGIRVFFYECQNENNDTPCNEGSTLLFSFFSFFACAMLVLRV